MQALPKGVGGKFVQFLLGFVGIYLAHCLSEECCHP